MNLIRFNKITSIALASSLLLSGCANYPTLVQIAKESRGADKNDPRASYQITDRDVLEYTDRVKNRLSSKFSLASGTRYGSSTTQATLSALAGAASTAGWAVSTASGFGLAATYVFALGQTIDAKGHAQAYEQAFTAIQSAEATYYFNQTGMRFGKDENGKTTVILPSNTPDSATRIPYSDRLTPDGQTLYYRVSKTLKVLNDVLASKIPDLQDLKDAKGDSSGSTAPPAKPGDAPSVKAFSNSSPTPASTPKPAASPTSIPDLPPARHSSTPPPAPSPTPTAIPDLPPVRP